MALRKLGADRFIRQAVKTIALDARIVQRLPQRKTLVHRRHAAVKGGIETRHLRHARKGCARGAHAGQVVPLVQWGQRAQCSDAGQDRVADERWAIESRAAVHDAVAHGRDFCAADLVQYLPKRMLVSYRLPPTAQAFNLARKLRFCQITFKREQRIFDR